MRILYWPLKKIICLFIFVPQRFASIIKTLLVIAVAQISALETQKPKTRAHGRWRGLPEWELWREKQTSMQNYFLPYLLFCRSEHSCKINLLFLYMSPANWVLPQIQFFWNSNTLAKYSVVLGVLASPSSSRETLLQREFLTSVIWGWLI